MTKMQQYMKAISVTCEEHTEFDTQCSKCYGALHKYSMGFGGWGSPTFFAISAMLNFVSQLDTVKWKPFMSPGAWKQHEGAHSAGWSRELYTERKAKYNKYYGITETPKKEHK